LQKTKEQWVKYVNGAGGETSRQLMDSEIPVPDAVVENFLNRGEIMILAGSPKRGKSVITTQLGIAVACGGKFLGEFQAQRGMVLLYDVDDGNRYRAQQRLEDLGLDAENENITLFHSLKSIPDGGIAQIECDLIAAAASGHKVNLVLIDCLLSILGTGLSRNVVQDQRRQIQELRALAVKYQFAGVIIHHTCKKAPKGAQGFSVFDAMLGTTGIGTVVDVGVVLEDTGRAGEVLARFSGRNPDTPTELALKLDRVGRTGWQVMSGGDQARKGRELGRVARAILEVLENAGTSMTPLEIAAEHKGEPKLKPSSVRGNCRRMLKKGYLTEHEGGRYGIPETPVTPVTASASDCGAASSESYSYSYTRPEEQPRPATVTETATLDMVPSPSAGTAEWSMPGLAGFPPPPPPRFSDQKQVPAESAAKVPQPAQGLAPVVEAPKAPTTAKKEKGVFRALNKLGGLAGAQDLADHWNALSKVGEIEAFMDGMCDRFLLRRRNTSAGTKYEKATDGQVQSEVAA
jgi:hypothetical protein